MTHSLIVIPSRELTLQSHQVADFMFGDFSENEPRHHGSVSYTRCPNKNATFFTKLKPMAFCSNAIIFLDSERV